MRLFRLIIFSCYYLLLTGHFAYAESENTVRVGDIITIILPGEESLNTTFQVDKQGQVTLPEIGPLTVAGKTEQQMVTIITMSLKTVMQDLNHLRVFISKRQLIINIQGYVNQPGEYIIADTDSVQLALYAAGGLRPGAQLNRLQLRRGDTITTFNYKSFLDSGDLSKLPTLQSLDTLFIPASAMIGNIEQEFDTAKLAQAGDAADDKNAVKVFGEVHDPGTFSYKEDATIVHVLMRAGGVTRYATVEQIRVISNNEPRTFNLKKYLDSGDETLLPKLYPGSTIFIPKQQEEIKFGANIVYVMGEVASPGAYEGKKGATFMGILANAGGPTRFAESRQIRIIKSHGEVINFDLSGYTEGTNYQAPPLIESGDAIFVPEKTDMNEKSWLKIAPHRAVRVFGEVEDPGRIEWSDEMSFLDLLAHVGGPTVRADTANIEVVTPDANGKNLVYTFNLDTFMLEGRPESSLPIIRAGATIRIRDLPLDPTDNKSQWVRQTSDSSIYIFGQVNSGGRYRFTNNLHFLDILAAADGPTIDADLHNIRVTHRNQKYSKVSKLDLALYFETGDESLLPIVKTGDSIYIPEKKRIWIDETNETTIRMLGAVHKPGRYRFHDSMTILDILAKAGGTTDNAYPEKISVINNSRHQGQARTFDLIKFSRTGDYKMLPVLRAGDTVYVPTKDESILANVRLGIQDIFQVLATLALIGSL
ncbi:sugar ABC transporter substrate-binding protein [Photobacterium kishitanii]|uniref:Sugar ABC transporter substrate-binding protein n=1 Tax=Photobacterium kishitanii TaxID=318456 RepID=A0AAX0YXI3_9GAMM|nr:SLBB domain-containing protein [Photobacterium kishitanii]KJG56588.1 sugar ABC transporter substrate-binding protein [Photobacterium kishitanii]KJG61086.1 sugar ABC transporter substrate-binding protein [Photobacterium kishitanii]KJG65249.1 sugar ABC transporter substrate-binding protein [Photobacterium kishitanii]OBU32316.1 sugar ABC transporter substrate-binding protein [Photobacterium kishitanii]PSV18148.1 sugar ABC transporter substrate-binding protein [Photobacterium kishitanii]